MGFQPFFPMGGRGGSNVVIRREDEKTERVLPNRLMWEGILWVELALVFVWAFLLLWAQFALFLLFLIPGLVVIPLMRRYNRVLDYEALNSVSWLYLIGLVVMAAVGAAFAWLELVQPALYQAGYALAWAFDPILSLPRWFWLIPIAIWLVGLFKGAGKLAFILDVVVGLGLLVAFGEWPRSAPEPRSLWLLLRVLSAPHVFAPVLFLLSLALHNWIEMLIGGVWPPPLERVDWTRGGIVGLIFPRLIPDWEEVEGQVVEVAAPPDHRLVTIHRRNHAHGEEPIESGAQEPVVGDAPDAVDRFYLSILQGEAGDPSGARFKEKMGREGIKGALEFGIRQVDWERLKQFCLDMGLVEKKGNQHVLVEPDFHVNATQAVAARWGIAAVPEKYRTEDYLGDVLDVPPDGGP